MSTRVTENAAAASEVALSHFRARLQLETDCSDVQADLASGVAEFVLLDVRGPNAFARGHAEGAINFPYGEMNEGTLAKWPMDTLFVVYCAGPHCNGADKAAYKLAQLGRPVKVMIGGVTGWIDEGFELVSAELAA